MKIFEYANLFAEVTRRNLEGFFGLQSKLVGSPVETTSICTDREYIVTLYFTGTVYGEYVLALDEATAIGILGWEEPVTEENQQELRDEICDALTEMLNTTVGEAIACVQDDYEKLTITPPRVLIGEIKYPNFRTAKSVLSTEMGDVECHFCIDLMRLDIADSYEEQAHELNEVRLESDQLFAAIDSVVVNADSQGVVRRWNRHASEVFGLPPEKTIGQPLETLPIQWTEEGFVDKLISVDGSTSTHVETTLKDEIGSSRILGFSSYPVCHETEHKGTLILGNDLTEQRTMEGRLRESQKLESIGELAAGVAHEINTPMQYVNDNVEFLSECSERLLKMIDVCNRSVFDGCEKTWSEKLREMEEMRDKCQLERIEQQIPEAFEECLEGVKRVIEIVRAMKQLSHPGSEEKIPTDINEALRSTATITKNRWKYAADLELDLETNLPNVKTHTAEINQVLINLIVNAADAIVEKYGDQGDLGTIVVRTRSTPDDIIIEVEDNGCGMPDEVQRRIFEPFFTTKEVGKGTGQGLAISYNVVVNHHQGILDVRSESGHGTCFIVKLPRKAEETETNTDVASSSA